MPRRSLTEETHKQVLKLLRQEKPSKDIARICNVSPAYVSYIAKRNGIKIFRRSKSGSWVTDWVNIFRQNANLNYSEIGSKYGMTRAAVLVLRSG